MEAFQLPLLCKSGPRQGRDMRVCVVKRERFPKRLLWRVVRTRRADGKPIVLFNEGQGRSVYVSRDLHSVQEGVRRKRLSKALKHAVPAGVAAQLQEKAEEWDQLGPTEKGLVYCEVYGKEGVSSAVEELQMGAVSTDGDGVCAEWV